MPNNKLFSAVSLGLELGFLIALPLVFFVAVGIFLDKKLNTLPIFLISAIIVSFAATLLEMKYVIAPFIEKRSKR